MAPASLPPVSCDRSDCPALAQQLIILYGQDFHFCGHHTVELLQMLSVHAPHTSTVAAERGDLVPAPV